MKKLLLTTIITLSAISAFAQTSVTGAGTAYSNLPPQCDEASFAGAQEAADMDAAKQCQGKAERKTDYQVGCEVLVHGYAARANATAQYECSSGTSLDANSTINLNDQMSEATLTIQYPTMQKICGVTFVTNDGAVKAFPAILAHLRFEIVRSGPEDIVPGNMTAENDRVSLSLGSFQANHFVTIKVTSTDGKPLSLGFPLAAKPVLCD